MLADKLFTLCVKGRNEWMSVEGAYSHEDEHLFATKVNTFFPSPHPFQILA